jgi:transcriptional regulator with XRE-family HTH domain
VKYPKSLSVFGGHVRKLRIEKKMTQMDLAVAAGIDRRTIQRIENGDVSPSFEILIGLALGFELPLRELMDIEIQETSYLA